MTSWLLNFPNINLNIAEPIDEFVRYININYGEVFVAAKKAHAGKIVALDVGIHAGLFAQSVEPNQRGREKAKVRARLLVKQRMQLFKSVHG